ncbi:hypothetical protein CBR_g38636 [Chara braunii]|uniref:Retrotransposon gag domain-containing protein n=1 Tax=Chara braunii TaxID=69332 RepID=A0A388K0H7_CHABU|nr:hypothetical protein CBR_g38636 [Chara braunii]|eukprot:GBG63570.1 hypothetical protein CBR_g38636 [Chara braunii]
MPETGGTSVVPKKGLTLDDLIAAIDRHERNPSNIPKLDTFHFCGERVSEWLERVEQALVGRPDVVKFQRILQYVLHSYHQEVKKVIDAAQGSWERFKEGMQRKYRLGDGLLTTTDLEAMNKEDFTTIGAFVQEFKKRARKVHGISEEAQCAIFLRLLTASEAVELTRHGGGGTASGTPAKTEEKGKGCDRLWDPGSNKDCYIRIGTARVCDRASGAKKGGDGCQSKRKRASDRGGQEELGEEEEPVPQHLTKVQRKVCNLAQGGQGSGKAQAPLTQAAAPLNVAAPSSCTGPSQGGAPSYGQWPWPVINAIVPWGSTPPVAGPQTSMPPPIYPAAHAQPVAPPPSPDPSSQGSVVGGGNQGQGNQGSRGRGGGKGRGRNGGGRGRQWNGQAGPVVPLAVEEGLSPSSSEPSQGSAEGSMGVLLEMVHTMREEVSLFSREQRIEEPLEREMGIEEEGAIEGRLQRIGTPEYEPEEIEERPTAVPGATLERRPQRLDTPEYVPATEDLRGRLGSWATGSGSGGPVPGIEQQEVASTAAPQAEQQGVVSTLVGSPSSPPPQPRKRKFKRKVNLYVFTAKGTCIWLWTVSSFLRIRQQGRSQR